MFACLAVLLLLLLQLLFCCLVISCLALDLHNVFVIDHFEGGSVVVAVLSAYVCFSVLDLYACGHQNWLERRQHL